MALLRLGLSGSSHRFHSDATSGVVEQTGILGVDIAHKTVGSTYYTVVQLLLDDMRADGDRSLLSSPLVAEITRTPESSPVDEVLADPALAGSSLATVAARVAGGDEGEQVVVATALFDHDEFRRRLRAEQDAGEKETHGVLTLNDGELPEPYIRLAFLEFPIRLTAGMELRIYRTTVDELNAKVEDAFGQGRINETERRSMLTSIGQHHPTDN